MRLHALARPLLPILSLALGVSGAVLLTAPPASALSSHVYVDEDGTDEGACSSFASACASITYALTQLESSGTVHVSGTIEDNVTVEGRGATTITGAGAARPAVIDGSASGPVFDLAGRSGTTLSDLTVRNGDSTDGGGILNHGTLLLDRVTLSGNHGRRGAGLYNWTGDVVVRDSTISGNVADGTILAEGGGIYTGLGSMTVLRSTISDNHAQGEGGGISLSSTEASNLVVEDSTLSGNRADGKGGAIRGSRYQVRSSTIAGNSATWGGALYVAGQWATLSQTTIGTNLGINAVFLDHGTLQTAASILGAGTGAACGGNLPTTVSYGHNLAVDASCGLTAPTDRASVDPGLGGLGDNGGGTATLLPAAAGAAAAAIPVGATAFDPPVALCPREDQRGMPSAGGACAVGAVEPVSWTELDQAPLSITSTTGPALAPLTLTTAGGSGHGAVTYTASGGTAIGCAVDGDTLTATSVGTCVVTASKAASGPYRPATSPATAVTFTRLPQVALTVTSLTGAARTPLTLTTAGGSGSGTVGFAAVNETASGCRISSSAPWTLTSDTAGTCVVTAVKAADALYAAAESPATTVTLAPAEQAPLTVTSVSGPVGQPLTLTTAGGSGEGAVTYTTTSGSADGCVVSPAPPYRLSADDSGTCVVTAFKAADAAYREGSSVPTPVTFRKLDQAPLVITSTRGRPDGVLPLVTAGGSGEGDVVFEVEDGTATGCDVSASFPVPWVLWVETAGTCVLTAIKYGDSTYEERRSEPTEIVFEGAAVQAPLVLTSTRANQGEALLLTTTGGSGAGRVLFHATDGSARGCTVSAAAPYSLTADSAGTCLVTAYKNGDATYASVSSAPTTVTFGRLPQVAVLVTTSRGTFGRPLALAATGGSGSGAVSWTATDGTARGCRVGGASLTSTTAGTCRVTATKAGDGQYDAAASPATTVTIAAVRAGAVRGLKAGGKPTAARRVVSWKKPTSTGGATITRYDVLVKRGAKTVRTLRVTDPRAVLKRAGLPSGRLTVVVTARTTAGKGAPAKVRLVVRPRR